MNSIETYRLSRDMKYEALYWSLGFEELVTSIFTKKYRSDLIAIIDVDKQVVDFSGRISIINGDALKLNTHKSFVVLECIDKLLSMGYVPNEIIVDLNNEYDVFLNGIYIKCDEWSQKLTADVIVSPGTFLSIRYQSRLVSGVIERKTLINDGSGSLFQFGIFENETKLEKYKLYNSYEIQSDDFLINGGVATKYIGTSSKAFVPEGVRELASCLFWDNPTIEEVVLPESLVDLGGDTFFNCVNLKTITIPHNVKFMGNNPFAGCINIQIQNNSPYFHLENGALYNWNYNKIIFYSPSNKEQKYLIKDGTRIVGKHSFYLCNNLECVKIPTSVIKLENNPFSGCEKLDLINGSDYYHVIDKVIYNREMDTITGCLNSISCPELILQNVKRIGRNSFWNCKGLINVVIPKTLEVIGYNPFVGCSNIEFESLSSKFVVENHALFIEDKSKLICYPPKYAVGEVFLPDEVITLERGAFSGCDKMTNINLHNVAVISKTCFTNCLNLEKIYCSDMVSYIGEWAFAHCQNLKEISVYKDCYLDKNLTLNSTARIEIRKERTNYIVESDNLFTFNSMTRSYTGKIKSILIDPPYNTRIDAIGYQDQGFSGGYCTFMKKRIELCHVLLSEDGFLVINIDKGEVHELSRLCNYVFGHKAKIYKWEKLHPLFDKNRNVNPRKKLVKYEYIILISKKKKTRLNLISKPLIVKGKIKEKWKKIPKILRCFGTTSSAKDEIEEIFGTRDYFSTPKPVKLMKELIRATTTKDSLICDFFAGSGTVGQATIELNQEDCGKRQYILVSNSENNICQEVTLKRIQKKDPSVVFLR